MRKSVSSSCALAAGRTRHRARYRGRAWPSALRAPLARSSPCRDGLAREHRGRQKPPFSSPWASRSAAAAGLVFIRARRILLDRRNGVGADEPAVKVDVGAALGAERAVAVERRLAADRASWRRRRGGVLPACSPAMPGNAPNQVPTPGRRPNLGRSVQSGAAKILQPWLSQLKWTG